MRLIDADALNDMINRSYPMTDRIDVHNGYAICQEMIKQLPTIEERKRGRWIHDGYDIPHGVDWMHCSVCGRREPHVPAAMTNFCPYCGADMRGEANERMDSFCGNN